MGDDARRPAGHRPASRAVRPASPSAVLTPPTGLPATPEAPDRARAAVPPRAPAPAATVVDPCTCGHGREVHEHWRRGTDCGICGVAGCARYRPRGGALRRLLRRLHLAR